MQRAFIKKIRQLKSDIRSCRFKNFSPKQASGLMGGGGGGPNPLDPLPGSATVWHMSVKCAAPEPCLLVTITACMVQNIIIENYY